MQKRRKQKQWEKLVQGYINKAGKAKKKKKKQEKSPWHAQHQNLYFLYTKTLYLLKMETLEMKVGLHYTSCFHPGS